MIVITGAARVADGNRAAFEQVAVRQVTLSRQEPGNVSYSYFEDRMEPGRFFFYEEWKDRAAVDFHFAQGYCHDFMEAAQARRSRARAHDPRDHGEGGVNHPDAERSRPFTNRSEGRVQTSPMPRFLPEFLRHRDGEQGRGPGCIELPRHILRPPSTEPGPPYGGRVFRCRVADTFEGQAHDPPPCRFCRLAPACRLPRFRRRPDCARQTPIIRSPTARALPNTRSTRRGARGRRPESVIVTQDGARYLMQTGEDGKLSAG